MIERPAIVSSKLNLDLEQIGIRMHDYTRPIYKYTSAETAKIILQQTAIRFRAPSTFNDPFEFYLDLLDTSLSEMEFKENFEATLGVKPEISPTERKKVVNEIGIGNFKSSHQKIFEESRNTTMVFCASEINNDILMWSHYANWHKGVCLGLLMPPAIPDIGCVTMRVNYTDIIKPERFYTANQEVSVLALQNWIYTKSACWRYEQEVRSFIINRQDKLHIGKEKYYDLQLQKYRLQEIYSGLNTPEKDIKEIQTIIKEKDYKLSIIKKMKNVKGAFALKAE